MQAEAQKVDQVTLVEIFMLQCNSSREGFEIGAIGFFFYFSNFREKIAFCWLDIFIDVAHSVDFYEFTSVLRFDLFI